MTESAVPLWLMQILPKWFLDRPSFTEAAFAFLKSLYHATYPIVGVMVYFAYESGAHDPISTIVWTWHNWYAVLIGYTLGIGPAAARAQQAHDKAAEAAKGV